MTTPAELFPPRPPSEPRKRVIGFRPSPDVLELLEAAHAAGHEMSGVIIDLVRIGRDAELALGPVDLAALKAKAEQKGLSLGTLIGQCASYLLHNGG